MRQPGYDMRSHLCIILTRLVTVWLIVLTVSPWTAPFAACDPGAGMNPVSNAAVMAALPAAGTPSLSDPDDAATLPSDAGLRAERPLLAPDLLTLASGSGVPMTVVRLPHRLSGTGHDATRHAIMRV